MSAQSLLWEKLLGPEFLSRRPEDSTLVCTTAPFAPVTLQRSFDELVFETAGFRAYNRSIPAQWLACSLTHDTTAAASQTSTSAAHKGAGTGSGAGQKLQKVYDVKGQSVHPSAPAWMKSSAPSVPRLSSCPLPVLSHGTGIVVDLGYSGTTITPMHAWHVLPEGVRRLPVGGKVLTNALKEVLSYRQFNVMDDPWLVDRIKEGLCYTAQDYGIEHAIAMRMKGVPTAPPALVKVMARATGRLAQKQRSSRVEPSAAPVPTLSRQDVSRVVDRVRQRIHSTKPMTSSRYTSGKEPSMPQPPQAQALDDTAALADLVPAVSNPSIRPQTGNDGTGIGVTRQFMLPDYMHVQVGYVLGSQADPMRALALAQAAASVPESSTAEAEATTRTVPSRSEVHSSSDSQEKRKKDKERKEEGAPAKRQRTESGKSSRRQDEEVRVSNKKKLTGGKARNKDVDGQGEGGEDTDANESSSISSEEEEEDEEEPVAVAAAAKKDSEYTASSSGAPVSRRQSSARASKAGVAALTSTLRRGGLLAEGDEDEDAGGAIEGSNRLPLGLSASAMSSSSFAAGASSGAGHAVLGDAQVMTIGVERFAVPEALFRPTDIGIDSVGLHEAVMAAVYACPRYLWQALLASVVVVGGTAKLPGLEARLKRELQAVAPAGAPVGLYTPSDPVVAVWRGGSIFGSRPDLHSVCVTREEYLEHGWERINAKLNLASGPAAYHLQDSEELEHIAAAIKAKQAAAAAASDGVGQGQGGGVRAANGLMGLEAWDGPADAWEESGDGDDDDGDEDY